MKLFYVTYHKDPNDPLITDSLRLVYSVENEQDIPAVVQESFLDITEIFSEDVTDLLEYLASPTTVFDEVTNSAELEEFADVISDDDAVGLVAVQSINSKGEVGISIPVMFDEYEAYSQTFIVSTRDGFGMIVKAIDESDALKLARDMMLSALDPEDFKDEAAVTRCEDLMVFLIPDDTEGVIGFIDFPPDVLEKKIAEYDEVVQQKSKAA